MVIAGSQSSQTTVTTSRAALPSYWQQVRQRSLRCSSSRHICEHHEVTNRQLSWSGDQSATWRVANRQLHSKPPAYHSDDDCARLSATFVQFFKDKLNHISVTIAANLSSSSATAQHTAARTYSGPMFDGFRAVNVTDVQRLLIKMPAKLSPLDVVPTSLLKLCLDIFAVLITRLANLSSCKGQFQSCFKTAQVLPLLKKG